MEEYNGVISSKLAQIIKELRKENPTIQIVRKAGNYGFLIYKKEPEYYITKKGERAEELRTIFNILELDGKLKCSEWFSTYTFNSAGDCIIGFVKKVDDPGSKKHQKESKDYRYGAINERGCFVVKPYYETLEFGSESTYIAGANNKQGYIDMGTGREITPIVFSKVYDFKNGLGRVEYKKDGRFLYYGYVSRDKKLTDPLNNEEYGISPQFIRATDFNNGRAKVAKEFFQEDYYINKEGQPIKNPTLELKR